MENNYLNLRDDIDQKMGHKLEDLSYNLLHDDFGYYYWKVKDGFQMENYHLYQRMSNIKKNLDQLRKN